MNNKTPTPKLSREVRDKFDAEYKKAIKDGHPPSVVAWTMAEGIATKLLHFQAQKYIEQVEGMRLATGDEDRYNQAIFKVVALLKEKDL